MKNTALFLLLFVWGNLCSEAIAQNFYTKSNKAIKLYQSAKEHFKNRQFEEGVEKLLKAVEVDDKFADAHYLLATTYELFREYNEAVKYYTKTVEVAPQETKFKKSHLYLAKSSLLSGNYQKAQQYADSFIKLNTTPNKETETAQQIIQNSQYAVEGMKKKLSYNPQPLENPLNNFRVQYFPVLTGDQNTIIYTVHKEDGTISKSKVYEPNEDLFISYKTNGKWSSPVPISENINTPDNEGTCSVSADGRVLVFTYCNNLKLRPNFGSCDLYITTKVGDKWTEPVNLGTNINTPAKETQPSLSADGRTLYFASNRAGGVGGLDIWVSVMDGNNQWTPAVNLGKTINTPFDEVSPFIHANSKTLYFSSIGFPEKCYGGFDIYQSDFKDKEWTAPQNLGYPLNDHTDQVALFISTDGKKGYYTLQEFRQDASRYVSKICSFDIPEEIAPKIKSNFLKGIVYDSKTKAKIEAQIDLFNLSENNVKQSSVNSNSQDGSYLIVLNQGSEYALEIHKKGYAFKSLTFNYSETKDIEPLTIDIPLDPISKGTVFRLNNIFFDYNKYELKEKSKAELDELVKFMQENPEVKGEISGHTDNIGNADTNMKLSLNRAKAVYDYLIQAGIDAPRLKFKGYGATKPDASNDTEEGRARNRRIEFEIL